MTKEAINACIEMLWCITRCNAATDEQKTRAAFMASRMTQATPDIFSDVFGSNPWSKK